MNLQAKTITRLYRMEDELMLTRAQTMHDNLAADLAAFTAKFPWLDATYVLSFQTDITTALSYLPDAASVNQIKVLTEDVNASVAEGMKALDTLDIYARVAYPNAPAKQRVFGQDNWDKARNDQEKMSKALKLANSFADTAPYKAALIAKGMVQADIDVLLTIAGNIDLKNKLQEFAISGRPVTTEDRIQVHNIVWVREQTISTCSELVFREDAAKRAQYLLYPQTTEPSGIDIVREAELVGPMPVNIPIADVVPTSHTRVLIEVTNNAMQAYAGATPAAVYNMGDPLLDLAIGNVDFSSAEFTTATGLGTVGDFLMVRLVGVGPGHIKITFTNVAE